MAGDLLEGPAVRQVALTPIEPPMSMFERLATRPDLSVENLERLMALWERSEARKAEAIFNSAMSKAQKDMRPVAADATNPQTKSRYASYPALDRVLRPIYTSHGFGLSFDTGDAAQPDFVRVLCYATHEGGHARTYRVDMPADGKGAKGGDVMTKTHATGSAMSYGQRYLLKLIFNIAVGDDDDGNKASGRQQQEREIVAPKGFEDWWTDMSATADNGFPALETAWAASRKEYKEHLNKTNRVGWEQLKVKALKAKVS